ncbi:MAG: prenyltransferase/squalene oxidase repeat-containing protein [Candidatus Sifarchaeia archaeon]
MIERWRKQLNFDPLPPLLTSENEAILYFAQRDLLDTKKMKSIETLWQLSQVKKLIRKQQEDGFWKYPGGDTSIRSRENYNQLETYRIIGELVEKYGVNKKHPAMQKAAEYLFSFQTEEGDFRGIYGTQYTPNYTAMIMEILIKAGYDNDPRIEKGFKWLLSIRQSDGGWAIPFRTVGKKLDRTMLHSEILMPDYSKPSAWLVTGCVLRAFAAHSEFRKTKEAKVAGELLVSRFFKRDKYSDRQAKDYWTRFAGIPFWFTDLLSSLDSLSYIGFSVDNPQIKEALNWFINNQEENGKWNLKLTKGSDKDLPLWMGFAICRVFKRFYG